MAESFDIAAYSDALVVLGTAGVIVPLFRKLGISPVLAYLGAGAALGPLGLGALIPDYPVLYWFTVGNAKSLEGIGELGIVFLFFLIGIELSFQRLMAMRRFVLGLGTVQVLVSAVVIAGIAIAAGQGVPVALVIGMTLALSSTAVVLEVLSNQGRLSTVTGRASFSVLLAQDIAVIPVLMFISIMGANAQGSVLQSLATALLQAALALVVIAVAGRVLLRPLFRIAAESRTSELFIAAVLFVIVGAGVLAHQAGLSMALGAFVAGLLLAETEFDKAIETAMAPFKSLLLGLFFFTVGMNIDIHEILRAPLWIAAGVFGLIAVKALLLVAAGRVFRLPLGAAVETSLLLGPGGEFAFVGVGLAAALGLAPPEVAGFVLAVVALSMALTPVLAIVGQRLAARLAPPVADDPDLAAQPHQVEDHAIVVGHGRVGKVVCALLKEHAVPFLAIDSHASSVSRERKEGSAVYYGDAGDPAFLKTCGLMAAKGVIVTIDAHQIVDEVVRNVRALRPDILIVARARDDRHARHLYAIGATNAVPETIEASLQLSEASLVGLGVATGLAIASIHEKRDGFRKILQSAAREAGRDGGQALPSRSKKTPEP